MKKFIVKLAFAASLALVSLNLQTNIASAADNERLISSFQAMGWSKTDFSKRSIEYDEILSGGPSRDGIPSIDKPVFKPISKIIKIKDREPVIGFEINGDARAYPLQILMWHEIVNDIVGGVPVTITFCPLCNSGIVFERTINGNVLDFGTTGLLRNSDLVMYDRQSESWWQQFTGTAIVGKMLGAELNALPSRMESFANFKKRFPNGKVLVPNNPGIRDYGRNPYVNYDRSARPFLYRGEMPKGINPMERVIVFRNNGKVHIFSMAFLAKKGRLSSQGIEINWTGGQASALDSSAIAKGRDVGNITVQKNVAGKLSDVTYDVTFAFVAHAFHPGVDIVTE